MDLNQDATQESNFDFKFVPVEPSGTNIVMTIKGKKNEWWPKMQDFVKAYFGEHRLEMFESQLQAIPDDLEEQSATVELKTDGMLPDCENQISDIAEISELIKETQLIAVHLHGTLEGINRDIVLLGEIHIATKAESVASSQIIPYFDGRGCEGIDARDFWEGRFFFWALGIIEKTFLKLALLLNGRSTQNTSAATIASKLLVATPLFYLEKGWKPTWRLRMGMVLLPLVYLWSLIDSTEKSVSSGNPSVIIITILMLVLIPCLILSANKTRFEKILEAVMGFMLDVIFDFTPSRDRNMTKNTIETLNKHESLKRFIVITGKGHTLNQARILVKKYGFVEKQRFNCETNPDI